MLLPTRAGTSRDTRALYAERVEKFGEERTRFLIETIDEWTQNYTRSALFEFDFTRPLHLDGQVKKMLAFESRFDHELRFHEALDFWIPVRILSL
jgi:hypothetical protein